ncbi:MAG: sigma-70 family RNA polymerase sigma factor [Syntrophomonadaceae bacterium]|nr:sigma-70 family RNA polymerase sigma factor [Syntrophomonadaceae bacterium]
MSRKFKTSKKKRTNYIYYGDGSGKTVLIPGEDGVTEAIIETLHSLDDEEVDNNRRETRRHSSLDDLNDKAETHMDPDGDVEDRIISEMEREWVKRVVNEAVSTLKPKEQNIIKWLYLSDNPPTQAEVAKELGMTEATVKKSAYRIRAKIKEILQGKI